ncbi:MAG: ABC transporter substrate-binding protein [Puniceicoccales bacterium]|nr:ABC transporter substrate-binding protein [Puniceicoccales bacterium]
MKFPKRFWAGLATCFCAAVFVFFYADIAFSAESARHSVPPEAVPVPAAAAQYYKSRPDFFHFAKIGDLPADLVWETNDADPEFSSPDARRGGVISFAIPTFPPALRRVGPNANNSFRSFIYDNYLIALTIDHPDTGRPIPGTATHWAVSKDRKTVFYRLNPSVRFTDGQPVSADDYLFTFYFHNSPHIQAPWYNDYYGTEFAGITKYDDYTISITLPDERPDPVYHTSIEPTPRNFFGDLGPDYVIKNQFLQQPTVGPYFVDHARIVAEQSITLRRVENWWGDRQRYFRHRYNPDEILYRVVRDPDKAFKMFLLGDLDLMEIRVPKYWHSLNKSPEVRDGYIEKHTFYYDRPVPTWGLYLNTIRPGLENREIRLGIQFATDWNRVINTFYRGDYQRLNQYAEGFGPLTNPRIRARPYSPDVARRHFAAAGFTESGSDGILRNPATGERLTFQLTCRDGDVRKCLPALVDSARKAGLEFRPEALEQTTFFKKTQEKKHDIALTAWQVSNKFPTYWEGFHMENALERNPDGTFSNNPRRQTNNITSTRDPELSKLIDRHRAARTLEEMRVLGHDIQQRIHDDACFVPGYKVVTTRVASWRWLKYPPGFGMRNSDDVFETGTYWLDPDAKAETAAARASGKTFPRVIAVHDRFDPEK